MDHISLIGAPTDVGASVLGCRMGPAALRLAGIQESLERFGSEVHDCGDVTGPDNPGAFAVDGYRHLAEVTAWNHAVFDAVYAELVGGRLPIMLGGDHCLAIGSISAAARHCRETGKRLRVLWFDAHADYNTASITPSGNMHGMPVAVLTGNGPEPLLNLSGAVPAVDPHDVREIGLRDVDLGEKHLLAEHEVEVFDMRYLDEIGVRHAMEMALKGVDENTHLHVSLDLDFLDDFDRPGGRDPGAWWADLPRGPPVHGDDRRHRATGQPGHRRAQPGTRRAQPDLDPRGRPRREPVRQEHPAAGAPALTPASRRERRADESRGTVGPCPCAVSTVPLRTTWPCATS
jgi:arginase